MRCGTRRERKNVIFFFIYVIPRCSITVIMIILFLNKNIRSIIYYNNILFLCIKVKFHSNYNCEKCFLFTALLIYVKPFFHALNSTPFKSRILISF